MTTPQSNIGFDAWATAKLVEVATAPRPWLQLFERKQLTIGPLIVDKEKRDLVVPLFTSLVEGNETDIEPYRSVVQGAWAELEKRILRLTESIRNSRIVDLPAMLSEDQVSGYVAFTEDLLADLTFWMHRVSKINEDIQDIACLARLHDALARRLQKADKASRFVSLVSERLRNSVGR